MTDYSSPELSSLPFDLYQRYRLAAEVLDRLRGPEETFEVLEIGGQPGYSRKFLPRDRVIVSDLLSGGNELDMVSDAESLPFPDRAFPVALAVDVLEHIPPELRSAAISEMARVSGEMVLIAAPFEYGLARSAEKLVFDFIREWLGYEHKYLKEHLDHPAPRLVETESELVRLGFDTVIIPNGALERWLVMMLGYYYFDGFPGALDLRKELSAFYNNNFFWMDIAEPAYRHLLVASRSRLRRNPAALEEITAKKQILPEPDYERFRLWLELFITGGTRRLLERIAELESRLSEKEVERSHREKYIAELEEFHRQVKAGIPYKLYRTLFKRK